MKKTLFKVKKGIILLTLCILASSLNFSVINAEEETAAVTSDAYKMARVMLDGIVKTELFAGEANSTVTRGEFTDAVLKLFQLDIATGNDEAVFSDVPKEHKYFEAIESAYTLKWISASQNFEPDRDITLPEAVKILMSAADYGEMAEQYGGFPQGYTTMANSLKLFSDINPDINRSITREDAVNLFYNLLNARAAEKTFVGNKKTYTLGDKDNLSKIYDMYFYDGIITQTTYNSLLMDRPIDQNGMIYIDGEACYYGMMQADMLGKNVRAVCKKDGGDVSAVCVYPIRNEEKNIPCDDFDKIEGTRVYFRESGNSKKITLDDSYVTVYNGRRVEKLEQEMIPGIDGKLSFLDNDRDGEYEIVFIDQYIYGKVASVDNLNNTINLKHNKKTDISGMTVELGTQNSYLSIRDSQGKDLELFELEPGSVVAVKQSKDLIYNEVILCDKTVGGKVTSISSDLDTVEIDEVSYSMTEYFKEQYFGDLKAGSNITLTLGMNDAAVCADGQAGGYDYGFLINAWTKESQDGIVLNIYDSKGNFNTYEAENKVKVDDVKTNYADVIDKLKAAQDGELPQLLRFSLSQDGKINGLDTAQEGGDVTFGKTQDGGNCLAAYEFGYNLQYKSGVQSFPGYCNVSRAKIFKVPNDVSEKELFEIWNVSRLSNDDRYSFVAYNLDENGFADVLLMRSDEKGLQPRSSSIMIEKVLESVTPDGDVGLEIKGWSMGKYVSYYVNPNEVLIKKKSGSSLGLGDIIRAYVDSNGVIKDMVVDFDANANAFSPNGNGGATFNGGNDILMYQEGGLYSVGSGMMYISNTVLKEGEITGSGNEAFKELPTYDYSFGNLRNYKLNTKYIVLCDRKNKRVRPITENELKSYVGSGDNEHYVILRQNAFSAICLFVYE